jgi:hypothetical protein
MQSTMHVYEVRPRKDKRGVDLISDALPFSRLWYGRAEPRQQQCAANISNEGTSIISFLAAQNPANAQWPKPP